tara:strand:+ start:334 stop:492 length:159 start_codon:yes stop_codon:yes gene_type:complete
MTQNEQVENTQPQKGCGCGSKKPVKQEVQKESSCCMQENKESSSEDNTINQE